MCVYYEIISVLTPMGAAKEYILRSFQYDVIGFPNTFP